jgi:broad specificity phosphatase PhoE
MKLSLLRHGEPVGGRIYRGNQDDPLTEKGWQQMLDASRNQSWDLIVTSPLLRCKSFARYLHQQQQSPLEIVDNFTELGFGDWQSQNSTQIGQDLVDAFKLNPIENKPPNAENLYDFQYRVLNAFKIITSKNSIFLE